VLRWSWLLVVALLALAQERDYRVTPKFEKPLDIDPLLQRVDAANDQWLGERDYEAIEKKLKSNGLASSGVAGRFARVDVQQFKIISSSRASLDDPRARLGVRVEISGETKAGERLALFSDWRTEWIQSGGEWKPETLMPGRWREVSGKGKDFTDVTEAVLGKNAAWKLHLSQSTDYWRARLDEATGIDVYGHNGVAVADYDNDGLEDFYVCQPSGLPNRLFHNNGDGTFTEQAAAAGIDLLDDTRMALFADIDNDGDQDLIAITASQPLLFRNDGQGRFTYDAASGLAIPDSRTASLTSAAVADFDGDGFLDLYVCSYDFWSPGRTYNSPTPYYDATNGPPNFLYKNQRGRRFLDVTREANLENNNRYSFAAAWGDCDNDGDPDLYVANDFGRNNLYRNNGDGTFTDVARQAGVEDLAAGMSAAWGDYDNDGNLDLYAGNMWSSAGLRVTHNPQFAGVARSEEVRQAFQRQARGNSLFHNNGNGTFSDVTLQAGVEMGRWAWSSQFADLNNDGYEDLFIQNGYITGADLHDL